jgi:ATP-dependent Clp protease ATP-binding subunit ClpC
MLAVSGLGCGAILGDESGWHAFERVEERKDGGHTTDRVTALVHVADWAPGPRRSRADLVEHARAALEQMPAAPIVVRRYQTEPQPLVRDAVRRYRTGRLDRVLAGDFDLF